MDYDNLNSSIIELNPKIRFSGIYHTGILQVFEKTQKGITRYFDEEKTRDTMIHVYMRWRARQNDAPVIGEPVYTITKY